MMHFYNNTHLGFDLVYSQITSATGMNTFMSPRQS